MYSMIRMYLLTFFIVLGTPGVSLGKDATMKVDQTCGCKFSDLQVEVQNVGNFPVQEDGTVVLKNIPEAVQASLESDIVGFWCPKYKCRHIIGEWTEIQDGKTFSSTCLKKPLPKLPCFFNKPKFLGWI